MRAVTAAVLQRPLLRRGTVARNAETGLRFHGVDRAQARARARGWLDRLGVGPLADRAAHTLSGGEAQRVSLARALAVGPRLLLLDEPFASLDSLTRGELLADLRAVLDETRTATLLVTHDHREAAALADRVAILDAGKLRQEGPVGDVLDNPADPASARVLGFENVVPGALWGLASPLVAVRAEDCAVAADGCGARATVRRVIPLGSTLRITAEADGHTVIATAPAAASAWLAAREGRQVVLGLDAARARAIRG
jgi:ABC-type sulfate/molybdate transport systems ATPase subunit